jgi:ribosomal protein S18 acetylase RimI-like enzyme
MGISPAHRKRGCGSQTLAIVIYEARARGDHLLELEVISTNAPALQLYKKFGFEILQDLYGFRHPAGEGHSNNKLEEVDIRTVAHKVAAAGAPDLPWQLSAETLASYGPPMKAYHCDGAYAVISDPVQSTITLISLIVEPDQRGMGRARTMLGTLVSEFGQKEITVPALCPASFERLFTSVGFERTKLSQHQMRLDIEGKNI